MNAADLKAVVNQSFFPDTVTVTRPAMVLLIDQDGFIGRDRHTFGLMPVKDLRFVTTPWRWTADNWSPPEGEPPLLEDEPGEEPDEGDDADREKAQLRPLRAVYEEKAKRKEVEYQKALLRGDPDEIAEAERQWREADADAEAVTHGVDPLFTKSECSLCGVVNGHSPSCLHAPHAERESALPPLDGFTLTDWLAVRDFPPPTATLLRRTDGKCLLVPGWLYDVHGESGHGKTMFALVAITQVVADGGTAVLIDFESSPTRVLERAGMMGLSIDVMCARLLRLELTADRLTPRRLDALCEWCAARRVGLVVVDSFPELLSVHGEDEDDNAAALRWYGHLKKLGAHGPAVLAIDQAGHEAARARGASGKKYKLDGSFNLRQQEPFSKEHAGYSRLWLRKDNDSALADLAAVNDLIGEMHVTPLDSGLSKVELRPPATWKQSEPKVKPDVTRVVLEYIKAQEWVPSAEAVIRTVHKRDSDVRAVIRDAKREGLLTDDEGGIRWVG